MSFYLLEIQKIKIERGNKKSNINILNFQKACNADGYRDANGNKLVEDGIDGANTQFIRKQINLKAKAIVLGYKTGSYGEVVVW